MTPRLMRQPCYESVFHCFDDIVVFLQKSLRFVVMAFRHGTPIQCFKGNIGLLHADAFGFCGQTQRLRVQ